MRLPTPLLRRDKRAYKNKFGHVLVLAGSQRMAGAAVLSSLAAMRTGAGLVTVGVPRSLTASVQKHLSPVVMTWPLPETLKKGLSPRAWGQVSVSLSRFQALAVGPGMGNDESTARFVRHLVGEATLPMVIDADGLNALAGHTAVLTRSSGIKILTPHLGEFARLLGIERREERTRLTDHQNLQRSRAREFARANQCVLVLKGHRTVITDPGGRQTVNMTGNVGMATAGSGDVLTGMVAALLAQGVEAGWAARTAVYLHGLAGDLAAAAKGRASLIATDIIECIPAALLKSRQTARDGL